MELLAAASYAWSLDVAFFVILLIGMIVGITQGFIKGVCKIAGTALSFIFAFFFCIPLHENLETWFGFTTLIANGIGSATVADWISVAICFIGLIIVVKLLTMIVGAIGKAILGASKVLTGVDRILGGILGIAEAFLVILILLMIMKWVNFDAANAFIGQSQIVGKIFNAQWFIDITQLPGKLISKG